MAVIRWIVIVLAMLNFGYMTYDGSRALIVGDYVRPQSGEYAGQLGPWAQLVSGIGIDPGSTLMKTVFMLWGIIGLVLAVSYAMKVNKAGKWLLVFNLTSLWYLVAGTISSMIQVILLAIYLRKR